MTTRLTVYGYQFKISALEESQQKLLQSAATYIVESDFENATKQTKCFYTRGRSQSDWVRIPRDLGFRVLGDPEQISVQRPSHSFTEEETMAFAVCAPISLRPEQIHALSAVEPLLRCFRGALLQAACGFGKTVCACELIRRMHVRTLILVDKISLVQQWQDRIREFLPGIFSVEVCTVQSLQSHFYGSQPQATQSHLLRFSMLILDEVHCFCTFARAQFLTDMPCFPYILGMSATPFRLDGAHRLLFDLIGPIAFRSFPILKTNVDVLRLVFTYPLTFRVPRVGNRVNFVQLVTELSQNGERTQHIADEILALDENRHVLVLSDRNALLHNLHRLLSSSDKKIYMLTGQKNNTPITQQTWDVILAATKCARDGLDVPYLNTLFMVTPMSCKRKKQITHNETAITEEIRRTFPAALPPLSTHRQHKFTSPQVEQAVGRILRTQTSTVRPLIVDVIDMVTVARTHATQRMSFYLLEKMNILPTKTIDLST